MAKKKKSVKAGRIQVLRQRMITTALVLLVLTQLPDASSASALLAALISTVVLSLVILLMIQVAGAQDSPSL